MNGPLLMMQIEQSMTHPVMQQRRRLYQGIEQLFVQVIEPVAAYGLMLRDCQGHPIVGPLEQMVREAVFSDDGLLQVIPTQQSHPLLYKLIGDEAVLQRCQMQLLARQAIMCINQAIAGLVALHDKRQIFLNRQDLEQLSGLHQQFAASLLARSLRIEPLTRLFKQDHPQVLRTPSGGLLLA